MKKIVVTIFVFFLVAHFFTAKAKRKEALLPIVSQTQSLKKLLQNADTFSVLFPQEKVYLHFDNSSYYIGEHIWFKAYVANAPDNHLSEMSRTLYVELLNRQGGLVERKIYPIMNGAANGDFLLKDTCQASYYEIRAYTRWMRNWDEGCIFSRVFPVFNKPVSKGEWFPTMIQSERMEPIDQRIALPYENDINLYFFPEGGDLIENVPSQIAFKFVDGGGNAINLKNYHPKLYNRTTGEYLDSLSVEHCGMGCFSLLPQSKMDYEVRIKRGKKELHFPLPEIKKEGCSLQVNNLSSTVMRVQVTRCDTLSADTLGLALTLRGKIYASQILPIAARVPVSLLFPKENLPEGVAELTLFDAYGRIRAQRKVFISNAAKRKASTINIECPVDSVHLSSCAFSQLRFRLTNTDGMPLPRTSFSVSVRDAKTDIPALPDGTPRENLLLASDLKGAIESPEYYFESEDLSHRYALDLLMRTQGWCRYSWEEQKNGKNFTPQFKAEKGITIDGIAWHLMNKSKPYADLGVSYALFADRPVTDKDKYLEFDGTKTDSIGEFSFVKNFFGNRRIVLQTRNSEGKRRETYLAFSRTFYPNMPRPLDEWETPLRFHYRNDSRKDSVAEAQLKEYGAANEILNDVVVKAKRKHIDRKVPHEPIVLDVQKCLDEVRDRGFEINNIESILYSFDPFYNISSKYMYGTHNGKPIQIVVSDNGIEKTPFKTMTFEEYCKKNCNKARWADGGSSLLGIKQIIIADAPVGIAKNAVAWNRGQENALVFITLFPDCYKRVEEYGQRKSRIYGYNMVDAFYSPAYISPSPELYDGRRTLMWMPDVYTDAQGIGQVDFYNSPTCRQIFINAQCVTRDGCIGSYRQLVGE